MSSNNDAAKSSLNNGSAMIGEAILAGHLDSDGHYQQDTLDPESNKQNQINKFDEFTTPINSPDYQPTNKIW